VVLCALMTHSGRCEQVMAMVANTTGLSVEDVSSSQLTLNITVRVPTSRRSSSGSGSSSSSSSSSDGSEWLTPGCCSRRGCVRACRVHLPHAKVAGRHRHWRACCVRACLPVCAPACLPACLPACQQSRRCGRCSTSWCSRCSPAAAVHLRGTMAAALAAAAAAAAGSCCWVPSCPRAVWRCWTWQRLLLA
jgi:hypothetical protein